MPVHLRPISRRRFLAGTLAAGAGWMAAGGAMGAAKETDEHTWALLADLHIAADRAETARKVNMADNLVKVCGELTGLARRPAGVIVNGDCAFDTGEAGDYAAMLELVRPLREAEMPVYLTVGNHDERGHFWKALGSLKPPTPVPDHQVALIKAARANWFVLDSLDRVRVVPGILGEAQLKWLAETLDANADKPALVVIHHNPNFTLGPENALRDTAELMEVIRPRRQVKAYIFGHTHDWSVKPDTSGIHLINLPPTAYVFTEGRPSGWVRAALQPTGARLELRCVDQTHKEHGQVVELAWRTG